MSISHIHKTTILFFLLLLIPVYWSFRCDIPAIQDLPYHLANTHILLKYHCAPYFQKYFIIKYLPYPYLLQDLLLGLFMLLGINFAAKAFLAITIISIPLGLFYLIKTINPQKTHLCYFSLPFVWNVMLFKGNLNYLLGIAISFVCLALLWKNLFIERSNRKSWILFGSWLILLYFAHLVAFALFLCMAAVLVFARIVKDGKRTIILAYSISLFIALVALVLCFKDYILPDQSILNFSDKLAFLPRAIRLFDKGDLNSLLPVLALLFILILFSMVRIKEHPLSFILCALLGAIYFLAPFELGPLVRPPERVYYMLLFLLPICGINQKYQVFEKVLVIIVCSATLINVFTEVKKHTDPNSLVLAKYRSLLQKIPREKKLMPIQMNGAYSGHVEAYYTIDRNGYIPSLFSAPYMMVNYQEKPIYSTNQAQITPEMLRKYDYLMVFGDRSSFEKSFNTVWFVLVERQAYQFPAGGNMVFQSDSVGIYRNICPPL